LKGTPQPSRSQTERQPDKPARTVIAEPLFAQLSTAIDGIRLSLHVLAATIWVGGQFTLAGLVPTAKRLGTDAPKQLARAFSRIMWPAYVVLLATGVWNVSAVSKGQPSSWKVVLGVKIAVVLVSGLGAWLHGRASTRRGLAVWGGVTALSATAALVMGVFLAG
jgi:putative copper export protein